MRLFSSNTNLIKQGIMVKQPTVYTFNNGNCITNWVILVTTLFVNSNIDRKTWPTKYQSHLTFTGCVIYTNMVFVIYQLLINFWMWCRRENSGRRCWPFIRRPKNRTQKSKISFWWNNTVLWELHMFMILRSFIFINSSQVLPRVIWLQPSSTM